MFWDRKIDLKIVLSDHLDLEIVFKSNQIRLLATALCFILPVAAIMIYNQQVLCY